MVYTFIINLGYVEDSDNSSLIFVMSCGDEDPDTAVEQLIRILLFEFCDGKSYKVVNFLRNFSKTTCDEAGDAGDIRLAEEYLDLWGVPQTGTIIHLNAFDHLFSSDLSNRRKFTMDISENVIVPDGPHHSRLEGLYNIDQMIKDHKGEKTQPIEMMKCPHCKGHGEVVATHIEG